MINIERLAELFKFLVEIDSEAKNEVGICLEIRKIMKSLGCETIVDNAGAKIGSNTGNLIAKFKGNKKAALLMLSAHMDTVVPGNEVKAILKDGVFKSDGTTILGADDKSAIAILIETLRVIVENNLECGPIEFVFTICEEIGLFGAKHLDYSLISAKYGYVLDTSGTKSIIIQAPSANYLEFKIYGKSAHAGIAPEEGINAISIASRAIANLESGRIDDETTCNIGVIRGGKAANIVPENVVVNGEVRSHSEAKLKEVTNKIINSFKESLEFFKSLYSESGEELPKLEVVCEKEFSSTAINKNHKVIKIAKKAAENLGRQLIETTTGGCADANIFFEKGIITGVLGTGMQDIHTVRESILLDDMVKTVRLMLEILRLASSIF